MHTTNNTQPNKEVPKQQQRHIPNDRGFKDRDNDQMAQSGMDKTRDQADPLWSGKGEDYQTASQTDKRRPDTEQGFKAPTNKPKS